MSYNVVGTSTPIGRRWCVVLVMEAMSGLHVVAFVCRSHASSKKELVGCLIVTCVFTPAMLLHDTMLHVTKEADRKGKTLTFTESAVIRSLGTRRSKIVNKIIQDVLNTIPLDDVPPKPKDPEALKRWHAAHSHLGEVCPTIAVSGSAPCYTCDMCRFQPRFMN